MDWWNSLTNLQRLLASIAAPATLFMVLQFILMLLGFAHGGEADSADSADHGDINLHDGVHEGLDGHDLADGHSHDIFSGHSHDLADGHSHDIFSGHSHDLADGHSHDIFSGHSHDLAEGHGHDIFSGHSHDLADGHSHDIFSGHSHDLADGHGHDIIGGYEHDSLGDHADVHSDDIAHDSTHEHPHHGENGHDKGDAMRLFTLRGIIAFLSVGGWMGVAAIDWKLPDILAVILALAAGWLALWFVAWIIRAFVRMQQSGNVRMENAVGKDGEVYLTVPENGHGKVNVIVQDRLCEMEAVTKAGRAIKTGEKITVLGIASEGVLLVAPKTSPEQRNPPEREKITG